MKKQFIILLLLPLVIFSQENSNFKFKSISVSPLAAFTGGNHGGFVIGGDLGIAYKENIFLLSAQFGQEFVVLSSYRDSFSTLSLSWGRIFEWTSWLQWDAFAGLSYFYYKEKNVAIRGYDRTSTIGFPITSSLKFMIGDYFSIGPQVRVHLNSIQSILTMGINFQVTF
ncbi:hypothetical protein KORDIASMS9_02122 [Kordia sp. SMS9]|uniref:hypothetical protein n=1 Tax=Kordia sp. SMS9 TaxID=2282170 RepID=UPI000E0D17DE|nr:hypothetical protein [Kordia sp. SMS9]AXG69894.1 hypothetical protein KORDIASMS9_02122 [Kordia sp. SMS9]